MGAAATTALVPDAIAQTHDQHAVAATPADAAAHGHGAFFNETDAVTVATFAERLMPGAPGKPGATEAGVLSYIDLALAGAMPISRISARPCGARRLLPNHPWQALRPACYALSSSENVW